MTPRRRTRGHLARLARCLIGALSPHDLKKITAAKASTDPLAIIDIDNAVFEAFRNLPDVQVKIINDILEKENT